MNDHGAGLAGFTEDARPRAQARAIADLDLDQGSNPSTTDRTSLSNAVRDETSSPKPEDKTVQQLQERCRMLESTLENTRTSATIDVQNLQTDLLAKNREIGRLKAELTQVAEEQPEAADAKALIRLWRDCYRRGDKRVDISLDSDRGKATLRAIKRRSADRIRKAILGVEFDDFAMGRTAKQDRPYNDLAKHILASSDRFEHFEQLFDEHHPEGAKAQRTQLELAPQPAPEPSAAKPRKRKLVDAPIDRVLGALPGEWRTTRDPDEWVAQCPAHDDHNPSLVIRRNPDGMVWIKCWAGCEKERILDVLGLEWRDMWENSEDDHGAANWPYRAKPEIPQHLRQAMQQLLARDERSAA